MQLNIQVNVLITENGVAVLADFGLTKAAQTGASWPVNPSADGFFTYRHA